MASWFWEALPLEGRSGSQIFEALFGEDPIAVLLESPYPPSPDFPDLARYSLCAGAPRPGRLWTPPLGGILDFLDQSPRSPHSNPDLPERLPFQGGWLGWLGYDLAWEIERLPRYHQDSLPFPVAFWYEPENFAVLDHQAQTVWLAATDFQVLKVLQRRLSRVSAPTPDQPVTAPLQFLQSQQDYEAAVKKALEYIYKGDIFQANLSLRFQTAPTQESWPVYRRLQSLNPSPFACYWRSPWGDVVSCSPERLVEARGQHIQTRPIAGTRPRGRSPQEEERFIEELTANPKERAEHIMLVDLERNDLGRLCRWGTVRVNELLTIERYSHVLHLVSNVTGELTTTAPGAILRALFPGGTITGCPKVRCLEIIEELEPVRRSLFYGSCGYLDRRGHLDLNILIRTLLFTPQAIVGQVGAGIVADSDPTQEWRESLQKAKALTQALGYGA